MQNLAPPQYSADGRWWWNGRGWVPVTWAVPAYDAGWDDTTYVDRERRQTPAVLWVGLAALIALLLLAFGGSLVSWASRQRPAIGTSPAPAPTAPAAPATPTPAPETGGASSFQQIVSAGVAQFQAAGQTVGDRCAPGAVSQDPADCRAALQSLDDTVQGLRSQLDGTTVPACLQPADTELMTALALYHQGIQQELRGIDNKDLGSIARGTATLNEANSHGQAAGSLLQNANC